MNPATPSPKFPQWKGGDIRVALANHEALRAELLAHWPELQEDEQALDDTLEGASDLHDMIAAVLRSALEDDSMVVGLTEYIAKLRARKQRIEERAQRKRALALHAMQEGQIKRLNRPEMTAFISMSRGKVIITDEEALDALYVRVKREPDKTAIGESLRAGNTVIGAVLSNPEPRLTVKPT